MVRRVAAALAVIVVAAVGWSLWGRKPEPAVVIAQAIDEKQSRPRLPWRVESVLVGGKANQALVPDDHFGFGLGATAAGLPITITIVSADDEPIKLTAEAALFTRGIFPSDEKEVARLAVVPAGDKRYEVHIPPGTLKSNMPYLIRFRKGEQELACGFTVGQY